MDAISLAQTHSAAEHDHAATLESLAPLLSQDKCLLHATYAHRDARGNEVAGYNACHTRDVSEMVDKYHYNSEVYAPMERKGNKLSVTQAIRKLDVGIQSDMLKYQRLIHPVAATDSSQSTGRRL